MVLRINKASVHRSLEHKNAAIWSLPLELHHLSKRSRAEGDKSRATPKPGLRCVAMRVLADTAVDVTDAGNARFPAIAELARESARARS
jgi:hypothetical protein